MCHRHEQECPSAPSHLRSCSIEHSHPCSTRTTGLQCLQGRLECEWCRPVHATVCLQQAQMALAWLVLRQVQAQEQALEQEQERKLEQEYRFHLVRHCQIGGAAWRERGCQYV